jgi:hypothetical protein
VRTDGDIISERRIKIEENVWAGENSKQRWEGTRVMKRLIELFAKKYSDNIISPVIVVIVTPSAQAMSSEGSWVSEGGEDELMIGGTGASLPCLTMFLPR